MTMQSAIYVYDPSNYRAVQCILGISYLHCSVGNQLYRQSPIQAVYVHAHQQCIFRQQVTYENSIPIASAPDCIKLDEASHGMSDLHTKYSEPEGIV